MNITRGIPSEIYVAIGRGRFNNQYDVAAEVAASFVSKIEKLKEEHAKMKETLRHILACNFTTDALQGFIGSVLQQIKK